MPHVRMFTLQQLGIKDRILSFDVIAKQLKIDKEDIELWVLKSIKHGLIHGKVDEFKEEVYISGTSKVWDDAQYEEQLKQKI